ncbi:MAG TPA: DJ-1/PfpI family protein [Acidimicrobiales bacterium]|nr:DJ-1/PfpI family protein [Acidimicrobiales bacterium]
MLRQETSSSDRSRPWWTACATPPRRSDPRRSPGAGRRSPAAGRRPPAAGRNLTSWPSLQTDIRNAGGTWVDEQVHVSTSGPNVLVTSRKSDDLPAFCKTALEVFSDART